MTPPASALASPPASALAAYDVAKVRSQFGTTGRSGIARSTITMGTAVKCTG